ncbi:MAG: CopD family protein [Actinomycetota bacterium]|nr:CopD family protein [Actinomycetota bacterium]
MGFEETFRSVGLTLARTISFASHAFLFGLIPLLWLVLRPSFIGLEGEPWMKSRARVSDRLEGMVQSAMTATAVATAVALVLQFALVSEVTGGEITSEPVFSVLETRFGQLYLLRFPLLAGLAVLLTGKVRQWSLSGAGDGGPPASRAWWIGWGALSFGLLATTTLSGHAAVGSPVLLSISNDLLHLVCGATWFTGIIVLALVVPDGWRGRRPEERVRLLAPVVLRFSLVALVTITILGITGTVNSLLHVGELNDLVDTTYGATLFVKIGLYLGVLAVGGVNHFYVRRKLNVAVASGRDDAVRGLFRKTIAIELVLALGIIGLTGFLTGEARTKEVAPTGSSRGVTAGPTP